MILAMSSNNSNDELINKIIHLMQTDESADAPADSVKWAKNIFRTRAAAEPKKSLVQKILAVLQMDLSGAQPAFGERSATLSQTRQMLFQAGDNAIDLRISEEENGFAVQGQILGEGFANCTAKLGDFESKANELSEFRFTQLPGGKYDLVLRTADREIEIAGLELN
ncbi:MAG: hypothetical protein M3384_12050 [Acidobacteriota bacterium]|nr:hypothetical protein [Acidobacteriota bacterium]